MSSHILPLTCPSCGAVIDVEEGSNRARCDHCGTVHLFNPEMSPPTPGVQKIRPKQPLPSSVRVEKDGKAFRLIKRWFSPKYIPMLIFVVPWNAFLCFWYSMVLNVRDPANSFPWIFIVFPLGHLAVGLGLTYSVLTGFLNRTVIELTREELSVWFEPLPWLGEKTYLTKDVKQIFCKEKISTGKNGSMRHQYDLYIVTTDLTQQLLVRDIESPEIALFFEQQLEQWMKITDQPVAGEIRKDVD